MKTKLKGIDEKTVVHCSTEELAKQVLKIAHDAGYKWYSEDSYVDISRWDYYKELTCYNFNNGAYGQISSYQLGNFKILPATKFIKINTPQRSGGDTPQQSFNLETYTPKRQLEGFPKEVIKRMLECQVEQGNHEDVVAFEFFNSYDLSDGGFDWDKTREGTDFWHKVISGKNFNLFFEKYPKQDHPKRYTVTREALGEIYPNVCTEWIEIIEKLVSDANQLSRFSSQITLSTDLIKKAWKDGEPKHKEWLTRNGLELPKKKVTKIVERWVNIYADENISAIHKTKELADRRASTGRLDCVKITIPYQVEE